MAARQNLSHTEMTKREIIHKELDALYDEGLEIAGALEKEENADFYFNYQNWYTKALKSIATLAPDRYTEFRNYYEIDSKRKSIGYGTYVIQDYIKNVAPVGYRDFDTREQAHGCFMNQLSILHAMNSRVNSVLANIEGELYAELQDNEIDVAKQLVKISVRAAGALVGVLIEGHLQKIADSHNVKVAKKNPTIADLNDPLKAALVTDTAAWRKISYLADLRNLCSHKKDIEPTKDQVEELIAGAEWLTKNVF